MRHSKDRHSGHLVNRLAQEGMHVERGAALPRPRCGHCGPAAEKLCNIAMQHDHEVIQPGSRACHNLNNPPKNR